MTIRTFYGGVHPPAFKGLTSGKAIKPALPPKKARLPLIQHTGAPCKPKVQKGDYVKRGQLIAEADAFITSPVHSSISGFVREIALLPHPILGECDTIVIESDNRDIPDGTIHPRKDAASLTRAEIIDIIKKCGIVGLGGAAFPAHVKLSPPKGKTIDTVILNGAECEPYLNCDYRLMLEKTSEIINGLKIVMKALGAGKAFVAVEDNKKEAILAFKESLRHIRRQAETCEIRVAALKTKYPQGGEKQLIKAVLKKEVPPGGLPLDIGCVVSNAGTAYAIYEAVYYNKPLYERVITVSGSSVMEPRNLLVRIGTPVSDVIDFCGGLKNDVEKIIMGGPMMGIGQYTLEVPVIKGTGGVVFLSKEEAKTSPESPCIRCGRCADVCPVNLMPAGIYKLVKHGEPEGAARFNPSDCMECGACAYECPSRIPLVHYIKLAKLSLRKTRESG